MNDDDATRFNSFAYEGTQRTMAGYTQNGVFLIDLLPGNELLQLSEWFCSFDRWVYASKVSISREKTMNEDLVGC